VFIEPCEGRFLIEGSDRLAMAFVVLSRARAARVKRPGLFCLVERVDWRLGLLEEVELEGVEVE
jgi:hypothetical protein